MDVRFSPHNTHHEDHKLFSRLDPHLRELHKQALIHRSHLLEELPSGEPGIYTIGGARQVGKTTLMKQWMSDLLQQDVPPECIVYMTGELIDDHHSLVRLVMDILRVMPERHLGHLLLDEVTYIRDWDKGIKYLADAGLLENVIMILSGSDLSIIKEARVRFPGRRGKAESVDFHLYPLDFQETVKLKKRLSTEALNRVFDPLTTPDASFMDMLFEEFSLFLSHGGFLTAINDMARHQRILPATFATYSDWIRGDFLKRGKQERYLREILEAIIKRYGSQVTWNALAKDLSIDHPKTVADYIALLESMDAAYVQGALSEHLLTAAPKKARKLIFTDPFIFHAVNAWLNPGKDPYANQVLPLIADRHWVSRLAEATATGIFRRYFPTYYIKAKGEVDIAYIHKQRFWPVEIKWTRQLRPHELKQISKYPNARILGKSRRPSEVMGIPVEPLPLALFRMGTLANQL